MLLIEKKETILIQMYEPVLLRKIKLSEKFPRNVLYLRKTALEIGLLALRTIVDILSLKLCIGNQRLSSKVVQLIQINKDNTRISYGYSERILSTQRKCKPNAIMWSDEIQEKLNRR